MKSVPKFRFKGFDTDWSNRTLDDVAIIARGKSRHRPRDASFLYGGQYPFIQTGDIRAAKLYITTFTQTYSEEGLKQSKLWNEGTLCVTIAANIAETAILKIKACFPDSVIGLIPKEDESDNLFIKYLFDKFKISIQSLSQGLAQANLNLEKLSSLEFLIPSLLEQQKIASFLSAVDEKIQQLTRKKELLEQYKKGVMQQLFSGILRFKDEHGENYPKWEEKKLGDVGNIISGLTYSPNDIHENGVLVLRSSNVQDRRLTFDDNVYVHVSPSDFNPVMENDILICVRNGSKNLIGKNALIDKKNTGIAFGAFMTVYRSDFNCYLFHYFDTDNYKNEVHKNLGATINSINGSDLKKFKVPFPSNAEQRKIANFLSAIDTKIESMTNQIIQTQTFKKGLLQQMFV